VTRAAAAVPAARGPRRLGSGLVPVIQRCVDVRVRSIVCLLLIGVGAGAGAGTGTAGAAGAPPPLPARSAPGHLVFRGGTIAGVGAADVEVRDGRIVAVGPGVGAGAPDATAIDARGRWLAPAFIDSHVHLAYWPVGPAVAAGGVAGAVDLAAPLEFLAAPHAPLRVIASGPMVTAPRGYPLESWGRDGYGLPVAGAKAAAAAVEKLHALGARVIKIPLTDPPVLDDATVRAVVERAHALGLKVAVHALGDDDARRAAAAGVDVLAHTPTEPLSEATVSAWAGRAVISTLDAFGAGFAAVENLARLRARGVTVLYGTDLGNSHVAGIALDELRLLGRAGLDPAAILAAATATPAAFWPFSDLGTIAPGKAASVLLLPADPLRDPLALGRATDVYVDGVRLGPAAP